MLKLIRTHPILTCFILGVSVALFFAFRPEAVLVSAAEVRRGSMSVYISAEGETRVKDLFIVSAPLSGTMSRIDLDVGDPITRTTPLSMIASLASPPLDPRTQQRAKAELEGARAALDAARAGAEAAEAEAELALTDLKRLLRVQEPQAVAAASLDLARARVESTAARARSARSGAKKAEYQLESARALAEYTRSATPQNGRFALTSPIDGVILRIMRDHAGPVQEGTPLVAVGNPQSLEVMVDVLSEDAVKISPGTRVFFERWGGPEPLEGVVTRVEPIGFTDVSSLGVDEQRVYVICDFTSPPSEWRRLGSGYRVVARFLLWHADTVLQIPSTSLFRRDESETEPSAWWVYTIENDRARLRKVSIGEQNGLYTRITHGLAPGEMVINHPGETLEPGARVELK
jgi:HlyD family secretion protein